MQLENRDEHGWSKNKIYNNESITQLIVKFHHKPSQFDGVVKSELTAT